MKNILYSYLFIFIAGMLFSCGNDDFPVPDESTAVADFTFASRNNGFAPDTLDFTNTSTVVEGSGQVVYTWNFGDGTSSSEKDPMHIYETPGTYEVNLVVKTDNDLSVKTRSILVKDPDALPVRLFYIDDQDNIIGEVDGPSFDIPGWGYGIEYHSSEEKIYYAVAETGELYRVNLDGSENELIVDGFGDGGARDIALDEENGTVYVTDRNTQGVWEVDIANKTKSLLYTVADDGLGELPVAIDFYDGNLYITCVEIDAESVWVGPVDGSGVTRIIDYSAGGYGYGLAVDQENEKIYFDDTDSGNILMANLDGTGIETFASTSGRVYGIAVDNTNGKVYWSDDGTGNIRMANLDGSSIVDLAVGLAGPKGIFYIE